MSTCEVSVPTYDNASSKLYRPLNEHRKEFRQLLVRRGSNTEPLDCVLQHAYLFENPPSFETVSYAWGDVHACHQILVNSHSPPVSANCAQVLRRMRHPDQDRLLWIDAVCIHQDDLRERSWQVSMMADIYSSAQCNLIWLGECPYIVASAAATAVRSIMGQVQEEIKEMCRFHEAVVHAQYGVSKHSTHPVHVDFDFSSLLQLFACPWFKRLWVVQEVALARQNICHYGDLQIPFKDIIRTARWLLHKQNHLHFRFWDEIGLGNAAMIWKYADSEQGTFGNNTTRAPATLFNLLDDLQSFEVHEPRDHVYGLLGLHRRLRQSSSRSSLLQVDYEKSLANILRDGTLYAIRESRSLEVFNYISRRSADDWGDVDFPSWVPRWDRSWDVSHDPTRFEWHFRACGSHQTPKQVSDPSSTRPDTLLAVGTVTGTNAKVLAIFDETASPHSYIDVVHRTLKILAELEMGEEESESIVAVTLVAGTDHQGAVVLPGDNLEAFRAWITYLVAHHSFPPASRGCDDSGKQSRLAAEYDKACKNACTNRSLFVTVEGQLGLGPQVSDVEDAVAVLWGCIYAVVLRGLRGTDEYAVLGTAYVEGLMHGEAIEGDQMVLREAQRFNLR
ncbi:hypothetical protein KC363_g5632 [Hortaea werneckii]|uniref:Heterokaryon incompatibility domain-containing protein n=1 Tax=Hortaea werneckii TaxID=91943 RepID=A0A3M7FIC5_HORWE|nr:hypothetical protein KC363_g5632 [Hortaea werneckii]RMY88231.1 hypothetical protein D0861_04953 [Hortaea werneckii]